MELRLVLRHLRYSVTFSKHFTCFLIFQAKTYLMIFVKSTNQPGDENMQQPIPPVLQDFQLKAKQ